MLDHTAPDLDLMLGDMMVVGRWPAKMMKALAVIADTLHPTLDSRPDAVPGNSKECCVIAALTVRDFLIEIGFADAAVRSVACIMQAEQGGKLLHSVGIGAPREAYGKTEHRIEPHKWDGHLVTTVPSLKLMIDATLYPSVRPQWADVQPHMIALPYGSNAGRRKIYRRKPLAGIEIERDGDYHFTMVWLDRPENRSWRNGPDVETWRRAVPVIAMRERFGEWRK